MIFHLRLHRPTPGVVSEQRRAPAPAVTRFGAAAVAIAVVVVGVLAAPAEAGAARVTAPEAGGHGRSRPAAAILARVGDQLGIYSASGPRIAVTKNLTDASLGWRLLVGEADGTFRVEGLDPLSGRLRWSFDGGFQALPLRNGSVFFLGQAPLDPHARTLWLRTRAGSIRRIARFPVVPELGPSYPLGYSSDVAGRTVAVVLGEEDLLEAYDVFVVTPRTGAVSRLTTGGHSTTAAVSPDGRSIVYQTKPGFTCTGDLMLASGKNYRSRTVLVRQACGAFRYAPRWISPRTVVAQTASGVVAVDVHTRRITRLTRSAHSALASASLVGTRVAYRVAGVPGVTVVRIKICSKNGRVSTGTSVHVAGDYARVAGDLVAPYNENGLQ